MEAPITPVPTQPTRVVAGEAGESGRSSTMAADITRDYLPGPAASGERVHHGWARWRLPGADTGVPGADTAPVPTGFRACPPEPALSTRSCAGHRPPPPPPRQPTPRPTRHPAG